MRRITIIGMALALIAVACDDGGQVGVPSKLTILSHDSFDFGVTEDTFAPFTAATGIPVEVISAGDAGALVNQAILTMDNPLADVLFGVDDTFLSRALENGIFEPHKAGGIDQVDQSLRVDGDAVTPISYGDVCFNYDKSWFDDTGAQLPATLDDLLPIADLVTVEHPATSSPGLAFMLATIDTFGEDGWLDWWGSMRELGVNVVADWDTAYYGDFTRYGGNSPIVMSYASSPPAEVIFAEEPLDEAPTGVIEAGCYRQVEYVGILTGTPYPESAGDLIDYMLSLEFQELVPLSWFVFPVNEDAILPQEFIDHTVIPEDPARFDPAFIAANRDRWIDQWVGLMDR